MRKRVWIIILEVLLGVAVLGGMYYKSQFEKGEQEFLEKHLNRLEYGVCLQEAEEDYREYGTTESIEMEDGTELTRNEIWERAENRKQQAIDNCRRQYEE